MKGWVMLVAMLLPVAATAELYKWTDAEGRVHFTDRRPAAAASVETLKVPRPQAPTDGGGVTAPAQDARSVLQRQKRMGEILAEEREEREAAQSRKEKELAARRQKCLEARDYRRNADGARLYEVNEKGERVFMDDAAHAEHLRELDAAIARLCQ